VIGGKQTERSDHCSDDNLGAVTRCDLTQSVNADTDRRMSDDFSFVQLVPKSIRTLFVRDRNELWFVPDNLVGEESYVLTASESGHSERCTERIDDA